MKRPMATEELFSIIWDILKNKGKLPDILNYGLATNNAVLNMQNRKKNHLHEFI